MVLRSILRTVFSKSSTTSERSNSTTTSCSSSSSSNQEYLETSQSLELRQDAVFLVHDHNPSVVPDESGTTCQTIKLPNDDRPCVSTTSNPDAVDIISNIPPEILMAIMDLLPLCSVAILSLCSRRFLAKVGKAYIETVSRGKGFIIPPIYGGKLANYREEVECRMTILQLERQKFLLLLQKQLPDEIFCFYCQIIHNPDKTDLDKIDKTGEFGNTGKSAILLRSCTKANRAYNAHYKGMIFSQVQLAMKRHRQGLHPTEQLKKLSRASEAEFKGDHNYLLSTKVRIIAGKLWLRAQHWILMPKNKLKWPTLRQRIPICCHWTEDNLFYGQLDPIACRISHKLEYDCEDCASMHSCDKCATEMQIDTKKLNGRHAVVVTVWKNLGEEETPFDLDWMSHWEHLWHVHYGDFTFVSPGGIKRVFEDRKLFVFDAHLPEDRQRSLRIKSSNPQRREYKNI